MERKHPHARCEECPLYEGSTFVPSEGPPKASVAFVGEAPGTGEAWHGRPFVGPSGQLLMKVVEAYGYKRSEVFLTNACLCRPPDNATPPAAAIAACTGRLVHELQERKVTDVVALGNTASQALLETRSGITSTRVGPPKPSPLVPGVSVVATWHPAYCLRNADAFPALVRDIGKLKEEPRAWSPPEWRAYSDPAEVLQVIDSLRTRTNRLVIDIEAGIEKDVAFDHPNEYDLLCVGVGYERGKVVVLGEPGIKDGEVADALGQLLRDNRVTAHNGKFDASGLYPLVGDIPIDFDTMLASYCLDETAGGHDLESLSIELLGSPSWKHEIKRYIPRGGNYADIPRPILYRYNAYDVANTWALEDHFVPLLEKKGLMRVHDFMVAAGNQLKFLELNGIAIDRDYSDRLAETYLAKLDEVEGRLADIAGHELNPRSPMQIRNYLLDNNVRVDSTNEDTIKVLLRRLDPDSGVAQFCNVLLEHRRKQKLYSTYVKGIRRRMYRGRVHTTYLLHGTTSGRLSSRNPNLQNIVRDKEIRGQFAVAKPENVFIHADYSQAEGRIMTWLAQDEYLRGILSDESRDIFHELGHDLYKDKFNPDDKDQRVRVKAYFYGLGYGREAYSIAMEYGIPVAEAERGLAAFKYLIPDIVKWQEGIRNTVLEGRDLVTPFGRHRRYMLITDQNRKDIMNEALSYLPQSTVSDICLAALTRLRPMLRGEAFLRLTIHDALVLEAPEERRDMVTDTVRRVMLEEANKIQTYVPFRVDVTYGKHWGEL